MDTPALDTLHRQHTNMMSRLFMLMGVGIVVMSIPLMLIGVGFFLLPVGVLCIWLARRMKRDSAKNLALAKQAAREAGSILQQ